MMLCGWEGNRMPGSLPPGGWLTVTCGLTACTPGSAPGPTLSIEYGKAFTFLLLYNINWLCRYSYYYKDVYSQTQWPHFRCTLLIFLKLWVTLSTRLALGNLIAISLRDFLQVCADLAIPFWSLHFQCTWTENSIFSHSSIVGRYICCWFCIVPALTFRFVCSKLNETKRPVP